LLDSVVLHIMASRLAGTFLKRLLWITALLRDSGSSTRG